MILEYCSEETTNANIVGSNTKQNPIMTKPRRRPLVATAVQAPLVELTPPIVPSENKFRNRSRRKPRVAPQ